MNARVSFYKETKFKEAQLGRIPEDWKTAKISKLFNLYKGTTPSTKIKEYWNGKIPFVTPTDITRVSNLNKIYLRETEKYITEKGLASKNLKLIPANSLLFTSRATIGYLAINDVKVTINQGVISLMPKDKNVETTFFYYLFQRLRSLFESLAGGSTYKEISMSTFSDIEIYLPSVSEQKTIAHILLTVDKAIQKTNEIIEKTERLKKGLMEELLTKGIGHKEFKDTEIGKIPKEWNIVRLGKALELCQYGLSIPMKNEGKYPIIRMDEIVDGYVSPKISKFVDLDEKTLKTFRLEKGDILFNRTNAYELVGRTGIFLLDGDYVFASYLIRLRPKPNMFDSHFLTYYLIFINKKLKRLATKAVHQANINATNLRKVKIPRPSLDEQRKIVKILLAVDKKLKMERVEKQRLEKIKQALMDLLLTGKVRVKVNEGA